MSLLVYQSQTQTGNVERERERVKERLAAKGPRESALVFSSSLIHEEDVDHQFL